MFSTDQVFDILAPLVLAPGVSGDEQRVAGVVERCLRAEGFALEEIRNDHLGNRWLHLGPEGAPQRLLLAHLDEIGQRKLLEQQRSGPPPA